MFRVLSRQVSRVDTVPHTGSRTPRWMSFSSSSDSSNSSSRGGGGNEIDVGSRNTFASPIPSPMPSSSSPSSSSLPSSSSMFASGASSPTSLFPNASFKKFNNNSSKFNQRTSNTTPSSYTRTAYSPSRGEEKVNARRILFYPRETYTPEQLNTENNPAAIDRLAKQKRVDIFKSMGKDPIQEYKNIPLLSLFVNDMGMIKRASASGLSINNQRRVAKAIKRARALGLMPYTYKLDISPVEQGRFFKRQ